MSPRSLRLVCAAVAVCLAASCAELTEIGADVCGNGVAEVGEDCDDVAGRLPKQGQPDASTACLGRGSVNQCRYGCVSSKDCPTGWGCNLEQGTCAAPTGTFTPLEPVDKNGAVRLVAGDFDGDGRTDLVLSQPSGLDGNSLASAYFYTSGMRIRERVALPISLGVTASIPSSVTTKALAAVSSAGASATAADAGESAFPISDLTFASAFGLGILRGSTDRPFVPELFPYLSLSFGLPDQKASQIIAIPKPPRDGSLRGQVGYFLTVKLGNQTALVPFELNGAPRFDPAITTAGNPQDVRFLVAPGGEALCFRGDGCAQALVWSKTPQNRDLLIVDAPPNVQRNPPRFTVEPGIDAVGVGDVDGDAIPDVVIGPKVGAGAQKEAFCPFVLYGNKLRAGNASLERLAGNCVGEPFVGLVDLNGDGLADFVYGSSIHVTSRADGGAQITRAEAYRRSSSSWSQLEVGDFDGDSRVDAILAVQGQSGLDVVRGGTGEMRVLSVPTPEPVDVITSGYFDADRMIDVAYTTKLVRTERNQEASAYIVFGGPENQTTPVGTKNVSQLVNLRRPIPEKFLPDTDFLGLVQDTEVVTGRGQKDPQAAPQAILFTAYVPQGRAAVSILRRTRNDSAVAGRAQAFGSFTGEGSLDALQVALTDRADCTQGATIQTVQGVLTPPILTNFGEIGSAPVGYGPQLPIALVAGKTGATDEAFFVTVREGQLVAYRARRRPPLFVLEPQEIYRAPYAPATGGACPVPNPREDALFPHEKLALLDLDDDGDLDLVFSDGGRLALKGQSDQKPGLMFALLNDGNGGFAPIAAPDLVGRSFAKVGLGAKGSALAVLSPDAISFFQVREGALARVDVIDFKPKKEAARALEAGDFDGDGVDDLAVLSAGTLQIYRGKARGAGVVNDGGAD